MLYVIAVIMVVLGLLVSNPHFIGYMGELKIAGYLKDLSKEYVVLNGVTIPDQRSGTTQIDHVVVSPYGIFVIETKNYSGWIFGDAKQSQWTQVQYKKKYRFQNPLRQNYKHVKSLQALTGLPAKSFIPIVAFMNRAKFKTDVPQGVFVSGFSAIDHLKSVKDEILTPEEMVSVIEKLETHALKKGLKTHFQHVAYVKNLQQEKSLPPPSPKVEAPAVPSIVNTEFTPPPICPKCQAEMILRTAKSGRNSGNQFWGCKRYPACRGIINA